MIAYFPKIYEDELLYSVFARFHIHTGYLFFDGTKNALFENKETTPIIEFINKLKPDVVDCLTKEMTMEEVIFKHTMFPFYGRFLNSRKKEEALNSLVNMESDFGRTVSKKLGKRYLKYCPLCAKEDRESKGEAIWYRKHQIFGVSVCPVHSCKLIDSKVMITRDIRIPYITAEQEAEETEIEKGTELERDFSQYISKLINPVMFNNGNVADFIMGKCKIPNREKFCDEINGFYTELIQIKEHTFGHDVIRKVLNGNNDNPLSICLVAFYLKIPVEELIGSYEGICDLERKKKVLTQKPKSRNYWKNRDNEYLKQLERAVNELRGNEERKPERICVSSVERALGIPKGNIRSMDKCVEYINKQSEDMETYHSRLVLWAISKIRKEGKQITWAQISVRTNIMYRYKDRCLNKLAEEADGELLKIINEIR